MLGSGGNLYIHFPHGMQALYRCWAWFEEQRHQSNRPVKLVVHFPGTFPFARSPFWKGISQILTESANVSFVELDNTTSTTYTSLKLDSSDVFILTGNEADYSFVKPSYAHSFRRYILSVKSSSHPSNITTTNRTAARTSSNDIQLSATTHMPRIAILNREKKPQNSERRRPCWYAEKEHRPRPGLRRPCCILREI